ncbi:MAG TPA: hypothetical protein VMN78_06705 [Longimicrobiales bacterium]|nr:hypothetical protein [Longimicrobiales bacterium]
MTTAIRRRIPTPLEALLALCLLLLPSAVDGQQTTDAYLDDTARELVARARRARGEQGAAIHSYTAVVLRRQAIRLRLPLRDRLLARDESAMRVRWSRDGDVVVQRLASREEEMGGAPTAGSGIDLGSLFDPDADRITFGIDFGFSEGAGGGGEPSEEGDTSRVSITVGSGGVEADVDEGDELSNFWIAHPLAEDSERFYRYRSGDTLTLRLPDGRAVRSVELSALPRRASFHHLRASLWIEPESGALVQAIYRPARELDIQRDTVFVDAESVDDLEMIPGMFRPIVFDLELMSVEYGLWDQRHWLPRRMSMEAYVRFGVVRLPFEAEIVYRIEDVDDEPVALLLSTEEVLASWGATDVVAADTVEVDGVRALVFQPADPADLLESEHLPPPVWEDAPAFASNEELEALAERLDVRVPGATLPGPPTFDLAWGLRGRGLVRYNRIEALSLGLRGAVDHWLGRAHATVRLGAADLHPGVELAALAPRRAFAWRLEAYHRLTTVDPGFAPFEAPPPPLGLGNSAGALLFGRDDGQYYRATGGFVAAEPRPEERQSYRVALFAERQTAARRKVEWNVAALVDHDRELRPNLPADEVDVAGASLTLSPWWGVGAGAQAGLEGFGEVATGDSTFARARLTGRSILPLGASLRLGLEAAAGHAWGGVPIQYGWFLGGPSTLRGYDGGVMAGASMARARVELARGGRGVALSLFSDAGWAGRRDDFAAQDALVSVGAGFTVLDGLLRVDVARALRAPTAWRLHLYLDALL